MLAQRALLHHVPGFLIAQISTPAHASTSKGCPMGRSTWRRPSRARPLRRAGYIQISADQEEVWGADAAAFVADEEDDMASVRTSGQLVLDELLRQADGAARMLSSTVGRRLQDAAQAKVRPAAVSRGCPSALQPAASGCMTPHRPRCASQKCPMAARFLFSRQPAPA